jgi:hypothetical protein
MMKPFDDETLMGLAELICGDEGPLYRKGYEIPKFFKRAGLPCAEWDREATRRFWAQDRLREYQRTPGAMEKVILRLANPREYRGDAQQTTEATKRLNDLIRVEGHKVTHAGGEPKLVAASFTIDTVSNEIVPLAYDLGPLVQDPALAEVLHARLEEARLARQAGAYLSVVILLGSVLEGALLALVQRKPAEANRSAKSPKDPKSNKPKPFHAWKLVELIDVAHDCGWVAADIRAFAHSLREYRNLVHPYAQRMMNDSPDADTASICWTVMAAALNDLVRVG